MKTHTNDYKTQLKQFGREIDSKITYTIDNEEVVLGTEELNTVTPHYEGGILKSVMKQLDLDSNVEIPIGTELNYQFGLKVNDSYEYIDFGNYIVYSSEKQEDTNSWSIICYDKLLYSMKTYKQPAIKNLLLVKDGEYNFNNTNTWNIHNQEITFSCNDITYDGGYINLITGTTAQAPSTLALQQPDQHLTPNGGIYTISCWRNGDINRAQNGFLGVYIALYDDENIRSTSAVFIHISNFASTTIELPENRHIGWIGLYSNYIECENIKLRVQLEEGTSTEYAPYFQYPTTIKNYLVALAYDMGLKLKNSPFVNENKVIQNELYLSIEEDEQGEEKTIDLGYTYRDVLDEIAAVTASTICINNNDEIELRYVTNTNDTIDEEYLKDTNVNFGEKYGPINSIVFSRAAGADNIYTKDQESILANGLCEVKIEDNQILNGNNRNDFINPIFNALNGFEYYINDFTSTGIGYYDLCDRYNVSIGGNTYSCVMFNDDFLVTQGLEEHIHADMPETSETDYKKADTTDRRLKQTTLIVDKQAQTITSMVSDLYDAVRNVKGNAVGMDNCAKGALHNLKLYGDIRPTLPSTSIYPSNSLFMLPGTFYLKQTYYVGEEANERLYELPFVYLGYISESIHDEFIIDRTGKCQLIHNVQLNNDGTYSPLVTPVIEDLGELVITNEEGRNEYEFIPYFTAYIDVDYVIKNELTDIYAATAEVTSQIQQTKHDITLEVEQKTDGNALISKINLTPGEIKLEGTVTANGNFQILQDGSIIAKNGSFSGNIYLDDGGEILGGNGLFSCLSFNSLGRWSSWSTLGFDVSGIDVQVTDVRRSDVYINAYIPENFVVSQAYIVLETSSVYSAYADASGNHDVVGTPKQLALLKGDGGTTVTYFYYPYSAMEEYTEYSGTEINDALGPGHYSPIIPSPGEVVILKSTNIAEYITSGENNPFIIRSMIEPRPVVKTYTAGGYTQYNYEEIVKNTGLGRASLYVFGFMKNNSEEE